MRFAGIAFVIALLAGLAAALVIPEKSLLPGDLIFGHRDLSGDCLACHTLGSGTPKSKCATCHRHGAIGILLVNGDSTGNARKGVEGLHIAVGNRECVACHSEHDGISAPVSSRFSHELLPSEIAGNCAECHAAQKPSDAIHQSLIQNCGACHKPDRWKPAQFQHDMLESQVLQACVTCHRSHLPSDELHRSVGGDNCATCHETASWKPSTFEHTKYFRFDREHPARCADCHNMKASLKAYTCYNCHEHSPQKIAREHMEEGIRNFENCVACHRSANKHEIEGRHPGSREVPYRESDDD